jgi:hypothetical protein
MRETTRAKLDKAFKKLGPDATYKAIGEESGVSYKAISEYKKETEISEVPVREIEAPKRKSEPMGDIVFFGIEDRRNAFDESGARTVDDSNGRIGSEYPAWMQDSQIESMQEDISSMEREIGRGVVDRDQIDRMRAEVKRKKHKLERIINSKPDLRGGDIDKIHNITKNLKSEIQDYQFTKSQMDMGTVRAEDEADRMSVKAIPLDRVGIDPGMAKELNLHPENGKVTRTEMEQAYRILSRSIGERGSSEDLRRDYVSARYAGRK